MYVLRCRYVSAQKRSASQKLSASSSFAPCGGTFSCAHPQCVPQEHLLRGAHWGALKGKANEDVSFDDISLVNGWYADLLCQHLDIPVAFRDTFW